MAMKIITNIKVSEENAEKQLLLPDLQNMTNIAPNPINSVGATRNEIATGTMITEAHKKTNSP